MYTVITQFDRPNKNIPYYIDTNLELKNEFINFIEDNNKLIIEVTTVESSNLSRMTTVVYPDADAFDKFILEFNRHFPTFFMDRDAYCEENNIKITRSVAQRVILDF
jgi:hypothetical protein